MLHCLILRLSWLHAEGHTGAGRVSEHLFQWGVTLSQHPPGRGRELRWRGGRTGTGRGL